MSLPPRSDVDGDVADATYCGAVDARLLAARQHDDGWPALLRAADGADPRLVAQRAHALGLAVRPWSPAGVRAPSSESSPSSWDPELHALDFEWYFEPACAATLAARLVGLGQVLCLGTPTVAFALLEHPACERVTLVDANPLATARHPGSPRLRSITDDLAAARVEAGRYDAVIFDAPWYPDDLLQWLAVAGASVRVGGRVLFALPRPLHRPSAAADRQRVLEVTRRMGPVRIEPAALRYETPRFEHEALAAAGVGIPTSWRRADLVEVIVEAAQREPMPAPLPTRSRWLRYVVGSQVLRLDRDAPDEPGDPLSPLLGSPDHRYASISTRDPQRAAIGLWTSRSRVARVRRPALVAHALEVLAHAPQRQALADDPVLRRLDPGTRARMLDALASIVGLG